jgi:membrane protein CcdC involved in cytochrome C biogenesis
VDYSLFMTVMMVLTSERVEKRPGVTPAAFPPPIFDGTTSVFYVSCFFAALLTIIQEGIYIGVFRSS